MPAPFIPPLAAIVDWLFIIIPIVFMVIWMLNQAFGKANPPPPRPRPGIPRPNPAAQPRPVQPAGNVNDEIENFLRRAAQARAAQAAQPAAPPGAAQAAPRQLVTSAAPALPSRRPRSPELVSAEVVDDEEGPSIKGSVAEHVQRHLDTRQFAERAAQMTKVDDADELMQGHLQQTFQHQVGSLAESPKQERASSKPRVGPAAELAAVFRDPSRIQQAVILQEILTRRDFI
jgi:hypothetical protein